MVYGIGFEKFSISISYSDKFKSMIRWSLYVSFDISISQLENILLFWNIQITCSINSVFTSSFKMQTNLLNTFQQILIWSYSLSLFKYHRFHTRIVQKKKICWYFEMYQGRMFFNFTAIPLKRSSIHNKLITITNTR